MRIRLQNELLPLNILAILLIIVIFFFPSNVLRIILGLPFVLFIPGYTLIAALFPRRSGLGSIERMILSFGLSVTVVPLIGLTLNFTPWGIRLYPILISLSVFILATSVIAWHRRRRLAEAERLTVSLSLNLAPWRAQSSIDKILSVLLVAAILGAVGTLGYVIVTPKVGESFTEFYILGPEGKAADYPEELKMGETEWVIVTIVNREHRPVTYRIEAVINGVKNSEVGLVMLEHDGKREATIGITPDKLGNNQKVEFLLYKNGESEAYLTCHFWTNVTE